MDTITNSQIEEIKTGIRIRPIPWDGYKRAKVLSEENAELFKALEKPGTTFIDTVASHVSEYVSAALTLLRDIPRDDLIKYLVLFLGDASLTVPAVSKAFASDPSNWQVLVSIINAGDAQKSLLAVRTFAILLSLQQAPNSAVNSFFDFIRNTLLTSETNEDTAVQVLALVLQKKELRDLAPVTELLKLAQCQILQVQYYALLSIWLVSFEPPLAKSLVIDNSAISILIETARTAIKEKVVRMSIAIILNVLKFDHTQAVSLLIAERGLPICTSLCQRKWADDELREDLEYLRGVLHDAFAKMTTFEEYDAELKAKHLQWSPPHKNPAFWRENLDEFQKQDWKALNILCSLLDSSDPTTQAVAAHDVTCILNESPEAIPIVSEHKQKLMALLGSADPEVRFQALQATQALLSKLFRN